jgi:hypothetical protein
MIRITTTRKGDKIVARSGNKQKTVTASAMLSEPKNHAEAAGDLGNRVIPTGKLDQARRTATAERLGPDRYRFTFDV